MDIRKLLQSLLEHRVVFLIIGAWALPAYGYVRTTEDVDVFIKPTVENAKRTMRALKEIGYDIIDGVGVSTFLKSKVLLREYVLRTDIHPFVAGTNFEEAWASRVETVIKGLKVFVPSLDIAIKMKEAAGRPKDTLDLQILREIKRQKSKNKQ